MSSRRKDKMFNPQAASSIMSGSNSTPRYSSVPPPPSMYSYNIPPVPKFQTQWSTVIMSLAYIEKLQLLCHSQQELKKEGYVLKPLSTVQIEAKLRCTKCGKRASRKPPPQPVSALTDVEDQKKSLREPDKPVCDETTGGCGKPGHTVNKCFQLHPELKPKAMRDREARKNKQRALAAEDTNVRGTLSEIPSATIHTAPLNKKKRSTACQYHIGRIRDKRFTCCNRHVSEEGCVEDEEHNLPASTDPASLVYWQYHSTPISTPVPTLTPVADPLQPKPRIRGKKQMKHHPLAVNRWVVPSTPTPSLSTTPPPNHLPAIALDCEMGTSSTSETELIRLTAVDFFTGAILIDNLVQPIVPMAHYNTKYSGVTWAAMREAVRSGSAILGRDRARMALLQFVGPETVVVVHGGSGDFSALRWIHPNVIDTFILEGYTGQKVEGGKSLQNLCKIKLGVDVQVRNRAQGKLGHDSYEDAMATRELAVQWAKGIPDS